MQGLQEESSKLLFYTRFLDREDYFWFAVVVDWMVPILMLGCLQVLSVHWPVIHTSPSPNMAP